MPSDNRYLVMDARGYCRKHTRAVSRARVISCLSVALCSVLAEGTVSGEPISQIALSPAEMAVDPQTRQVLAPTGKLRAGLYLGGPTNIIQGALPQENKGVGYDVAMELSRQLGVPLEPVIYSNAAGVQDGLKNGQLDVAFLARTPERERTFLLTKPLLSIEQGFLVPQSSAISSMDGVDRPGIRIGTPQGGSVNFVIAGFVKSATVTSVPGLAAAAAMLKSGQLDAFAANKANLFELADKLPGARVLDGRFGLDEITITFPRGRDTALPYLLQFLDSAKKRGVISDAVKRAGLRGAIGE